VTFQVSKTSTLFEERYDEPIKNSDERLSGSYKRADQLLP